MSDLKDPGSHALPIQNEWLCSRLLAAYGLPVFCFDTSVEASKRRDTRSC